MKLNCNWRGNPILKLECKGDQMAVNYGGKGGWQDVCEVHANALRQISPLSGAKFIRIKQEDKS